MHNVSTASSFKDFLFKNRENKRVLWLAAIAIVVQFTLFKYFYPYASYIHGDSFSYIRAAAQNLDINTYMIGYSRFLRFFGTITSSDMALVAFQYLFIQGAALFFLFTLFFFYKPGNIAKAILLVFMVFNPLFLHIANLVSSDCLFAGLSIIWFSLLLWLIHRPNKHVIIYHSIVLFLAFTIRYNALIYPFISIIAFALSRLPLSQKIIGIASGFFLCALFFTYTGYKYQKLTGYWQYSPFSGWQFTNNAMYAYRYVDSAHRKPVPDKFKVLDNMIRQYFDSTRDLKKYPVERLQASTVYMWEPKLTLYKYRNMLFKKDTAAIELKKWASMGPFYASYGLFLIKQYPGYYLKHFIWPNANKYYAPPVEFLEAYNSGANFVTPETQKWFGYDSQIIKTRLKSKKVWVLDFYPILSGVINALMLLSIFCYTSLKGWRYNKQIFKLFVVGGTLWVLNAAFTIFASSAALRFQTFPILLTTTVTTIFVDWMVQLMGHLKREAEKPIRSDYETDEMLQHPVF